MLTIRRAQMQTFERHQAALAARIAEQLRARFRVVGADAAGAMSDADLQAFARDAVAAAAAVRIDEPRLTERFARALFQLNRNGDRQRLAWFTQVMLSEQSPQARLSFVERHLLAPALVAAGAAARS